MDVFWLIMIAGLIIGGAVWLAALHLALEHVRQERDELLDILTDQEDFPC